jgi:hypothetical protein
MAAGDILFYHADDPGGWLIDWRTHGPYSHVCVEVEGGNVVEAKWPKVSYDIRGKPTTVFTPKLNPLKLPDAFTWLNSTVGKEYDVLDILANVFGFLLPHTKIVSRTPTEYICSELTAYFLMKAGYAFPPTFALDERSLSLVTPNDIARLVGILH